MTTFWCRVCGEEGNPVLMCRCGARRWSSAQPPPKPPSPAPVVPFELTDYDRIILIHYGYPAAQVLERGVCA